jgi:DNA primase
MFPIRDRRGAMISFGGRIMGDGQPKYVNGPETAVFSKRRSLYGLNLAREVLRKGAPLIVVEGYMDVIALSQAGFGGAVAPLGTALTEEHLAELWRLSPEPVICFDGDAAGRRAALKTVDLALSALAPDRSLKFLHLPEKEDPDSIIRREGPMAFTARLKNAAPISEALFGMLAEGASSETPESRAVFYKRLEDAAARIPDKALAKEYRAVLIGRFFSEWRPSNKFKQTAKPAHRRSQQTVIRPEDANVRRGYVILSVLINLPALFPFFEEALFRISFAPPCLEIFRHLQDFINDEKVIDHEGFISYLEGFGLDGKVRQVIATAAADYRPSSEMQLSEAAKAIWHFYYLMPETISLLKEQCEQQLRHFLEHPDDQESLAKLVKYQELQLKARAGEFEGADELTYSPAGEAGLKEVRMT